MIFAALALKVVHNTASRKEAQKQEQEQVSGTGKNCLLLLSAPAPVCAICG